MLTLPKSILVSACLHAGLLSAFFFTTRPSGARVLYQPQYQVRLVEPSQLPSLGGKKEAPAPKPAPPPKPAEPKPPPPPPKPPPEKAVKLPEKKAAAKPEVRKTDAAEKKVPPEPDGRPQETSPAAQDPNQAGVLEDVLARLRKEVEGRAATETGRPSGPASSGWEARQGESRTHDYYDQVERIVRSNWIPPKSLEFSRQNRIAVVSLTLLPDGRVLESYIEEASGDPHFDQSVMRAILKSTPLPPPPVGLGQERYELGLRFHSHPHTR